MGIQISGIGAMCPERRNDLMSLGFRALFAATLASCMCGAVVGIVSSAAMAKLYFYYSTMNAGKSTALLQAGHNYEERGMRTLLYTAQDRFPRRRPDPLAHRHRARGAAFSSGARPASEIAAEHRESRSPACSSTNRNS